MSAGGQRIDLFVAFITITAFEIWLQLCFTEHIMLFKVTIKPLLLYANSYKYPGDSVDPLRAVFEKIKWSLKGLIKRANIVPCWPGCRLVGTSLLGE